MLHLFVRLSLAVSMFVVSSVSLAQEAESDTGAEAAVAKPVYLKIRAAAVDDRSKAIHLLPDPTKRKQGNAADLLKEIVKAEKAQETQYLSHARELETLLAESDESAESTETEELSKSLDGLMEKLKLSAETVGADWEMRFDDGPWDQIVLDEPALITRLLRDAVGIRNRQAIASGKYEEGIRGVSVLLGNARHIAEIPFGVTQILGFTVANVGLGSVEKISEGVNSPNLYHALDRLPDRIVNLRESVHFEAQFIRKSLPLLTDPIPGVGDKAWGPIAEQFSDLMVRSYGISLNNPAQAMAARLAVLLKATSELPEVTEFSKDDLKKMSPEEIMMRWILAYNDIFAARWKKASELPIAMRLVKVRELQDEIEAQRKETGLPGTPFRGYSCSSVVLEYRFQRRVNFLQTIESIRHHVATNDRQLPKSLDELELPSPADPLTEKPFDYSASKSIAKLRYPRIPGEELPEYAPYILKVVR